MFGASVPAGAGAETAPDCETWNADITSITATGPGAVTVSGVATTPIKNGTTGPCAYDAQLAGYTIVRTSPKSWNLGEVTATVPLPATWSSGDQFTQQLNLPAGTQAVCVRTPSSPYHTVVTCDDVFVGAEKDGSPMTPVVGRQIYPRDSDGGDVCGNCV